MAQSTYLQLCNKVLKSLNEVPFSTETEFSNAVGFADHVKNSVNWAVAEIYNKEINEWPFAAQMVPVTLTIGVNTYTVPATYSSIDWDSFYIDNNPAITEDPYAKVIEYISWDQYKDDYLERDLNATIPDQYGKPFVVARDLDNNFILSPKPKYAFTLKYRGFTMPTTLDTAASTCSIPERFEQVIIDGALYRCYMFRDNTEQGAIAWDAFTQGIDRMRRVLIPQPTTMRFE